MVCRSAGSGMALSIGCTRVSNHDSQWNRRMVGAQSGQGGGIREESTSEYTKCARNKKPPWWGQQLLIAVSLVTELLVVGYSSCSIARLQTRRYLIHYWQSWYSR